MLYLFLLYHHNPYYSYHDHRNLFLLFVDLSLIDLNHPLHNYHLLEDTDVGKRKDRRRDMKDDYFVAGTAVELNLCYVHQRHDGSDVEKVENRA